MFFRTELRRIFSDIKLKLYFFIFSLLYVFTYIFLKKEYFFELINYISKYIHYYVSEYLGGNILELISNEKLWLYIENDVSKIYSATFLYFATQKSFIFTLLLLLTTFAIFHFVNKNWYDEIKSGFYKNIIIRIGRKKYFIQKILSTSLSGGLIALIPKLFYLILLQIFFTQGYSEIHFLDNTNFIPLSYQFFQGGLNPTQLLICDLMMTFIYGILISILSVIIILLSEKKSNSYIAFVIVLVTEYLISIILIYNFQFSYIPPIIYLFSILKYISIITVDFSIFVLALQLLFFTLALIIIYFRIVRKMVYQNG